MKETSSTSLRKACHLGVCRHGFSTPLKCGSLARILHSKGGINWKGIWWALLSDTNALLWRLRVRSILMHLEAVAGFRRWGGVQAHRNVPAV